MNRKRPFWKRFWMTMGVALSLAFAVILAGLYKFYLMADQIYEAEPAPAAPQVREAPVKQAPLKQAPLKQPRFRADEPVEVAEEDGAESSEQREKDRRLAAKIAELQQSLPAKSKGAETFLLLGVDSRQGEAARSDTIIVATVPQAGGPVHLLSIPRDTHVSVPGHGQTKINHAMTYGGAKLLKQTVEQFLLVPIDHVVTIDFEGFRKVVDEVGGLPITVEKEMDYDDPTDGTSIHLHQGQTLATGKQALDYARFRNDAEADTGRMRRQKQVIRAMMQKGGEPEHWPRLFRLTRILGEHVKTDLPPREMVRLLMAYRNASAEQVKSLEIAGENRISEYDDLWYFFVSERERSRISHLLRGIRQGNL